MRGLKAITADMRALLDGAKADGRDLTDDELAQFENLKAEAEDAKARAEKAAKANSFFTELASIQVTERPEAPADPEAAKSADEPRTLGERFVKSAAFKGFRQAHPEGLTPEGGSWDVKAQVGDATEALRSKATITTATGQFVGEQRLDGYRNLMAPDDGLGFLDLITLGNTQATFLEYATIVSETDNAAVVPEGELKPLSDVTTGKGEAKAYTYADGFDVTNQTLADDGALVAFMDSRIRYHVQNVVVDKLINGSGTGEPQGILATSGVQSQAFDTDAMTTLARAIEKLEAINTEAQAIVMNPADIWTLRMLKDTTGRYIFGGPETNGAFAPWGVRVVKSTRVAKGKFLTGNFKSVQFLQREALNVMLFNQHKDYAQRNMSYVRAEMRGMQLIPVPRDIVVGSLAAA